ncbi:MAG TPA: PEP-CTERM sorting domain-containing protein [Phycisphaerae bacterium]|nr:PEP-CTERM sorting domain-containing protein [Phycisphaerae bacterium]
MKGTTTIAVVVTLCLGTYAAASPSLPITKPPVTPVPSWTGPVQDPHAIQGQWFRNYATGHEEYRTHEFYDNLPGLGGGFAGCNAIYGKVMNVQMQGLNIIGLTIQAQITNDTPGEGQWADGNNSHEEYLHTPEKYFGPLFGTKLTAEFAVTDTANLPAVWNAPYRNTNPYIIALNEDQAAWYCWTPGNPAGRWPFGNYYVPAWDFGNIMPGQTATRIMNFAVSGPGMTPADLRYGVIMNSWDSPWGVGDVFLNRTTDLKIGDWIDDIALDNGQPYPPLTPLRSGDVSVFHDVPEPATLGLMLLSGLALLRRRS